MLCMLCRRDWGRLRRRLRVEFAKVRLRRPLPCLLLLLGRRWHADNVLEGLCAGLRPLLPLGQAACMARSATHITATTSRPALKPLHQPPQHHNPSLPHTAEAPLLRSRRTTPMCGSARRSGASTPNPTRRCLWPGLTRAARAPATWSAPLRPLAACGCVPRGRSAINALALSAHDVRNGQRLKQGWRWAAKQGTGAGQSPKRRTPCRRPDRRLSHLPVPGASARGHIVYMLRAPR